ncbi:MAG TPA: hypothetical protein DCL15_05790 [Chloroflexi bacterium]|nr:hypothetical protein [Chloroflexota bacterium]HHW85123.1 hypothetical protein [Chloroflexota bacterium]
MTISPILDQPQSIDYADLPSGAFNRLANHELSCWLDAACNPHAIHWSWGDRIYAQSITLRVIDLQEGELTPLATRFFPGHQEVITGSEGVIVTKRLGAPYKTTDDRALFWLLECQAEGDRVLRLEIDIDWGEPLSQRIVDGLLVAQHNPGPARGLYQQSNAESTRIFGNPHGRPDQVDLDDPARAHLIYHVLVNGIVEVPLIFTVSDVGEQLAWNSFLSLREVEEIFDISSRNWARRLHAGRLWTPDPEFNLAVESARLAAIRHLQRHRTGTAPSDRRVEHIPMLVAAWDALDPVQSRNLLAHLWRVAEATEGRLPATLPALPNLAVAGRPEDLPMTNGVYIQTLAAHIHRHRSPAQFISEHLNGVRLCADALVQLRIEEPARVSSPTYRQALVAHLRTAAQLAAHVGDEVNAARWDSEWHYLAQMDGMAPPVATHHYDLAQWRAVSGWQYLPDRPAGFDDPWTGMTLVGAAIWQGVGLRDRGDAIFVEPTWMVQRWPWWALLGVTLTEERRLSMVWDGATLHTTRPVRSGLPVEVHRQIQLLHVDEFDFDPVFEMIRRDAGSTEERVRFKPRFHPKA